ELHEVRVHVDLGLRAALRGRVELARQGERNAVALLVRVGGGCGVGADGERDGRFLAAKDRVLVLVQDEEHPVGVGRPLRRLLDREGQGRDVVGPHRGRRWAEPVSAGARRRLTEPGRTGVTAGPGGAVRAARRSGRCWGRTEYWAAVPASASRSWPSSGCPPALPGRAAAHWTWSSSPSPRWSRPGSRCARPAAAAGSPPAPPG